MAAAAPAYQPVVAKQNEVWRPAEAYRIGNAFDLSVFDINVFDATGTWGAVSKQSEVWNKS